MSHSENTPRASILLVDDSLVDLEVLSLVCESLDCLVDVASDGYTAVSLYEAKRHTIVLADYHMYPMNGIDVVAKIRHLNPDACCLVMTAYSDVIIRRFVRDNEIHQLVTKPIEVNALIETLRVALDRHSSETPQVDAVALNNRMDSCLALLGESALIAEVRGCLFDCVYSQSPLLVEGDAGVGKPCIVHLLHDYGPYGDGPFIELHCDQWDPDALPQQLINEQGQWGAALKASQGGTLVLYHPQALPLVLQRTLVQYFQQIADSMHVIIVGDVSLSDEVVAGRLDEQLYEKIAVQTVRIPSLSERPEDVCSMVHAVAISPARFGLARLLGREELEGLIEKIEQFDLPGNQAELIEWVRRQSDVATVSW